MINDSFDKDTFIINLIDTSRITQEVKKRNIVRHSCSCIIFF